MLSKTVIKQLHQRKWHLSSSKGFSQTLPSRNFGLFQTWVRSKIQTHGISLVWNSKNTCFQDLLQFTNAYLLPHKSCISYGMSSRLSICHQTWNQLQNKSSWDVKLSIWITSLPRVLYFYVSLMFISRIAIVNIF